MTTDAEREWLTVAEFRARHPQLGRNLVYEAARSGRLPSIRIGKGRILIPSDAFDRLLDSSDVKP